MRVAEEELMWQIRSIALIYIPARQVIDECWQKKDDFHKSGELILIDRACPWKDHLFDLEEENNQVGKIKFAFFKDDRGLWRVQAIPLRNSPFENRISLAKAWRGLRGEELKKVSGFEDAEFIHHAGFIGGAWSLESCIKMAEVSIQEHNDEKTK